MTGTRFTSPDTPAVSSALRRLLIPTAVLATVSALTAAAAAAQGIREERIEFARGASSTTVDGRITGDQIVDYLVRANGGQEIQIEMTTRSTSAYFNLMRGDDPTAIHVGSTSGNSYVGLLPVNGDYRIRVYLMRSAARRGESADYSLRVGIAATNPDAADALSGGPDFFQVANVPAGETLNVRSGPGTDNGVIGEIGNGERVRNLGCRMVAQARWCQIEAGGTEMPFKGWVNGRYLVEAGGAPAANMESSGEVPCSTSAGQPSGRCKFRASRGAGGNASVWITLPSGGERYIQFKEGEPVGTDPGLQMTFEKNADLYLIRIGNERYELPEAIVYGG